MDASWLQGQEGEGGGERALVDARRYRTGLAAPGRGASEQPRPRRGQAANKDEHLSGEDARREMHGPVEDTPPLPAGKDEHLSGEDTPPLDDAPSGSVTPPLEAGRAFGPRP